MGLSITILGCGTSTGVPLIGCRCPVCTHSDPRNRRSRASIAVAWGGRRVLVDTSTDLRAQMLAGRIDRIDAVLYTHSHADHIHGIDELRSFNFLQRQSIPVHADRDTLARLSAYFTYIFQNEGCCEGGGRPYLDLIPVDGPFELFDLPVVPLPVMHGSRQILGWRFGRFAYLTDCSRIPDATAGLLSGLDLLVIGALRRDPHPTHFSVDQALEEIERLGPARAVLTHMGHDLEYANLKKSLPDGVEPAYDGQTLNVSA